MSHFAVIDTISSDVDSYVAYVWSQYVAEASINKQLYSIKSEDVDLVSKFSTKRGEWKTKDLQYGSINTAADAGYFDVTFNNTPVDTADLGEISWGDLTIKNIPTIDSFNEVAIDFNKSSKNEKLEVILFRSDRWSVSRCDFVNYEKSTCSNIKKSVFSTNDATQNWMLIDWHKVSFDPGEDGYSHRIRIDGLLPDSYDYRLTFSTISWKTTPMAYHAYKNGVKTKIINNIVEIDTIGTAIDNYARVKLQKRITDEISPLSKYVLFADGEIAQ